MAVFSMDLFELFSSRSQKFSLLNSTQLYITETPNTKQQSREAVNLFLHLCYKIAITHLVWWHHLQVLWPKNPIMDRDAWAWEMEEKNASFLVILAIKFESWSDHGKPLAGLNEFMSFKLFYALICSFTVVFFSFFLALWCSLPLNA